MASIIIRQASDGPRYMVRFRVDGTMRNKTFRRSKEAESYKRKVEGDESAGLLIDPRGGEVIFGPYAAAWIEKRIVRGRPLTPATSQGYRQLLRRHLEPSFGRTSLRRITPERVRNWNADLVVSAGADQAAKSYRLLRAILGTALEDDLIGRNPCRISGAGTEHAPERPIIETATVLDLADAIDVRLRALVLLGGFGGLRPGELLGLLRGDVDTVKRTVTVRHEAHEIRHVRDDEGNIVKRGGRVVTEPKSEAGKRTVALPAAVADSLAAHLDLYTLPGADAIVFTRKTGRPLRRADLSEAWTAALKAVGVTEVHVHDLRHHAATTAARTGITTKELMSRIGHSSPRAALIYQHATAERDREVADQLDALIAATPRKSAKVVRLSPRAVRAQNDSVASGRSVENSL